MYNPETVLQLWCTDDKIYHILWRGEFMRMSGWTLFFCAATLGMLALLWSDYVRRQHEEMDKQRMRGSMLYYEIYPLVLEARKHAIDHVVVERTRVVFFSVCPPGEIGAYAMTEWGHRPLNSRRILALAQAIADDVPILQENRCYRVKHYKVTRPNGIRDDAYQFMIRSGYKAQLMYARQRKPRLY